MHHVQSTAPISISPAGYCLRICLKKVSHPALLLINSGLSESRISGWPLQPWQAVAGPPGIPTHSVEVKLLTTESDPIGEIGNVFCTEARVPAPWQYRLYQGIGLALIGTVAFLVKTRTTKQCIHSHLHTPSISTAISRESLANQSHRIYTRSEPWWHSPLNSAGPAESQVRGHSLQAFL